MIIALPCDLAVDVIGGKAHGLATLMKLGLDVPRAFVITADTDVDDAAFARELTAAIASLTAAGERDGHGDVDIALAVRSSGVDEDGATASYAGVHDTVLDVRGVDAALAAVRTCRASAESARARAYRSHAPRDGGGVDGGGDARVHAAGLAVIVQLLVRADVAGVCFSADPIARRRDRAVVEAVAGLGESLVSGAANPDRAVVDRARDVVVERAVVAGVLDDPLAIRIARTAVSLEQRLGFAVDVEWAVAGGRLFLLQVRPITTSLERAPRIVWTNTNAAEILPDVAKPLVYDVIRRWVRALLLPIVDPFGLDPLGIDALGLVAGRVYFNLNAVLGWMRAFPGLQKRDMAGLAKLLGGDLASLRGEIEQLTPADLPQRHLSTFSALIGTARVMLLFARNQSGDAGAAVARLHLRNLAFTRVDVGALDDAALLGHIDDVTRAPFGDDADYAACSGVGMICQTALPLFTKRYLHDHSGALAGRLLQRIGGLDSAEAGRALGRLGRAIAQFDVDGVGESAPEFRAALTSFLERHGHHARGEADVSVRRWSEEPAYVTRLARAAAASSTVPSTVSVVESTARHREVVDEASAQLGFVKRTLLRALVSRAAKGAAARENGKSEAVRNIACARTAILEVGRRLKERAVLDDVDDVFFLLLDEFAPSLDCAPGTRDHLRENDRAHDRERIRERVHERKAEHARNLALSPPPVVVGVFDPARPAAARHAPPLEPPREGEGGCVLHGVCASAGVAEGAARVILRADDDSVVLPGEILVAPFTDPGWTPYFLVAAGIVMDFGGMLSHGSVVAREYALPAVVNTGDATKRIVTGQRVRVDGNAGTVTILDVTGS